MNSSSTVSYKAHAGELDLRGVDLAHNIVSLDGAWHLLWENRDTLNVVQPGSWVNVRKDRRNLPLQGFARYELRVLLSPGHERHMLISTKEINAQSQIWINGEQLAVIGNKRLYRSIIVDADTLQLTMLVSNRFDISPGIPCPVYLGQDEMMDHRATLYLGVQSLLLGIFVFISLLYLTLWIMRRSEHALLLLAMNTFFWGVYTFFQGVEASPAEILFPNMPMIWQQKAYMLSTAVSFPMTCLLWLVLFPSRMLRNVMPVLIFVSVLYGLALLVSPEIHWQWFSWYLIVGNSFLAILLWVALVAARKGEPGSRVFLLGLLGMYAVFVYGTIVFRGEWMGFGALLLVLSDAFLLARRRAQAFDTIAEQRAELERVSRLKEELSTAVRDKFQLALTERRLSTLLNLVDSPILVLNEQDQISFANNQTLQLLGYSATEMMQMKWSNLCIKESTANAEFHACTLRCARRPPLVCSLRHVELLLGDDSSRAFFILDFKASKQNVDLLLNQAELEDPSQLARETLRLSMEIWEDATGLTKADFAEFSSIWTVSVDSNGWRRTQTLDKYLALDKAIKFPKWRKILDSADFVELTCEHQNWTSEKRTQLLSLRKHLGKIVA